MIVSLVLVVFIIMMIEGEDYGSMVGVTDDKPDACRLFGAGKAYGK